MMEKKQIQGLTNRTTIINNHFVKKSRSFHDYYLDRENENKFYQQAQNWNFIKIPKKIEKNWQGLWISKMPYLPNAKTLSQVDLTRQRFAAVIALINKLHEQKADLATFKPKEFLEQFTIKTGLLTQLKPLKNVVEKIIQDFFSDSDKLVPSHNDLIRDNFLILNQKMYLIDFEYASLNHPLFDYASFITESLSFSEAKRFEKMLNLTHREMNKLHQIALYQDFLWAHWAEYLYQTTKKKVYRKIKLEKIKNAWRRAEEYNLLKNKKQLLI